MKPTIVIDDFKGGYHNQDLEATRSRLLKGNTYKDCSTIIIIPTRGVIPAKVVQNWFSLISPMNQKLIRIFAIGMEVGEAYSNTIETILANTELSKFRFILTLEEDNCPPPDGLLRLIESIETDKKLGAVGGLYHTKGIEGQPMIYGNPNEMPRNFIPQIPQIDTLQYCNGLGMGFTLFRMEIFKDSKIPKPWFKTVQEYKPGQGVSMFTQDLHFFNNAAGAGWKFACNTSCKVGHYSIEEDICW